MHMIKMSNAVEETLFNNLMTYATVLFGNAESSVTGTNDGHWIHLSVTIFGERTFSFSNQGHYSISALSAIFRQWRLWREELGITEDSQIPEVNSHMLRVDVKLTFKGEGDFLERAKQLLHPLSIVHGSKPMGARAEQLIARN